MIEDAELLRRYAEEKSEAAFAELVRRHLDLVYSVAHRQVGGDAHLAQDVAQIVFAALARKARSLVSRPVLAGWLHRSAQFAAIDVVRAERRRRAREQEAHAMPDHLATSPGNSSPDWEKLRPLLDRAIAELDEHDRDAVVLRFFNGRTFVDIGTTLRLTENGARMRVERALDKLHATLARHGVTSTSAALATALSSPSAVAAPAGLAASLAGAALAVASVGGVGAAAGGIAFMSMTKTITVAAGGLALLAGGTAYVQTERLHDAEAARVTAERQSVTLNDELTKATERLRRAEQRVAEADKDSGDLLRAVDAVRTQKAAAKQAPTAVPASGIVAAVMATDDQERLAMERSYAQELARRRAVEAKQMAELEDAVKAMGPARGYEFMLAAVERTVANSEFQTALKLFNRALELKPPEVAYSDAVLALRSTLQAQSKPVDLTLISDEMTHVMIANFKSPEKFGSKSVKMLPGDYQVIGRRRGYQDVTTTIQVRGGAPLPPVTVICTTPVTQ